MFKLAGKWKQVAVASALALPLLLGACTGRSGIALCAEGAPGTLSVGEVFNGAAGSHNNICRVRGSDLKPEGRYAFSGGLLAVDGDVPAGARLHVDDRKVAVTGDVGAAAVITASVPEEIGSYITIIPIYNGQTTMMLPQTNYYFDGYTYAGDTDPALIVLGSVAEDARLTSNHGTHVSGGLAESAEVRYSRDAFKPRLTQGRADTFFIQPHL